jgi:hypothetical protein
MGYLHDWDEYAQRSAEGQARQDAFIELRSDVTDDPTWAAEVITSLREIVVDMIRNSESEAERLMSSERIASARRTSRLEGYKLQESDGTRSGTRRRN